MGFNIYIINANNPLESDCNQFINRSFYNFIASYDVYGEDSVIIQSGKYFDLDLHLLTNLAYTWDDIPKEEIEQKKQTTEVLIKLVEKFIEKINVDPQFIKQVKFKYEDYYARYTEADLKSMKASGLQIDPNWNEKVEMHQYFIEGKINIDLDAFLSNLKCYQLKSVNEVVLAAG